MSESDDHTIDEVEAEESDSPRAVALARLNSYEGSAAQGMRVILDTRTGEVGHTLFTAEAYPPLEPHEQLVTIGRRFSAGAVAALGVVGRGRGRPPVGERVEVRIPADDLAALDVIAAERDATRAELVREAVAAFVREA